MEDEEEGSLGQVCKREEEAQDEDGQDGERDETAAEQRVEGRMGEKVVDALKRVEVCW